MHAMFRGSVYHHSHLYTIYTCKAGLQEYLAGYIIPFRNAIAFPYDVRKCGWGEVCFETRLGIN